MDLWSHGFFTFPEVRSAESVDSDFGRDTFPLFTASDSPFTARLGSRSRPAARVIVYEMFAGKAKGRTVWMTTLAGTEATDVIELEPTQRWDSIDARANWKLPVKKPESSFV